MELFGPVLGMTMIVVGFILLFGSIGLLLYGVWTGGKGRGGATSVSGGPADGQVEVGPT